MARPTTMDTFKILCNMEDTGLRPSPEFSAEYTLRTGSSPPLNQEDILRRDATAITLVEERGGNWCFIDRVEVHQVPRIFENYYVVDVFYREALGYPVRECITINYEKAYRDAIVAFLSTGDCVVLEERCAAIIEGKAAFANLNRRAGG